MLQQGPFPCLHAPVALMSFSVTHVYSFRIKVMCLGSRNVNTCRYGSRSCNRVAKGSALESDSGTLGHTIRERWVAIAECRQGLIYSQTEFHHLGDICSMIPPCLWGHARQRRDGRTQNDGRTWDDGGPSDVYLTAPVEQVSMEDFEAALAEVKPAFGAVTETLEEYRLNGIIEYSNHFRHLLATCKTLVEQVMPVIQSMTPLQPTSN